MAETRTPIDTYRGFEIFLMGAGDLEIGGNLVAELYWARATWNHSIQVNAPTRADVRKIIWEWWEKP